MIQNEIELFQKETRIGIAAISVSMVDITCFGDPTSAYRVAEVIIKPAFPWDTVFRR